MLASVGARTLLDRAGHILIGDVRGGFEGKLSSLVAGGHISAQEKDALDAVADAGNASAHRGNSLTAERLSRTFAAEILLVTFPGDFCRGCFIVN